MDFNWAAADMHCWDCSNGITVACAQSAPREGRPLLCRRAYEEHRSRAAAAAATRSSRSSWAAQAAAELVQAELAGDGDGAYQGSWTFMGSSGQEMGPFLKSELISMFEK